MLPIPRRYAHFVFGVIQSGLTSAIAAGVATFRGPGIGLLSQWAISWLIAWAMMIPLVLFAAPLIQHFAHVLTRPPANTRR